MRRITTLITCMLLMASFHAEAAKFESAADAVKNMGLGWNLGNTLDANIQTVTDPTSAAYWGQQGLDSETCWGQYPTKPELMKMMKDAGFGAIRVPVTWYNHMDSNGNVDKAWMARVHEVVDYVINQGMYCIINVHHDTGADSNDRKSWIKADEANYTQNKARYEKLWRQIAEEFKDYDHHLLFESYNEMLDKLNSWNFASSSASGQYDASIAASAYKAINSYAQSFVTTVRATGGNNSQRNLIINTYGCSNGSGSWNQHLKDPLTELKYPSDTAGKGHIIFQVHAYPSLVEGNSNRTVSSVRNEINEMIKTLNTNLVSKGAPVIIGEWGTSNVDAAVTDYDARRELMFRFCEYFVQKCKENNISTFYWMGLTDGMSRFLPAFSQPDLASTLLKAYHGSSYEPVLPDAADFSISCTVDFNQQWSELNLYSGSSFTSADYVSASLELETTPAAGLLQWKVYCSKYSEGYTSDISSANSTLAFTADMGTITGITLQCKQNSGKARVKSIKLKKKNGEEVTCNPSVSWGCTMSDITVNSTANINGVKQDSMPGGRIYDLSGRRINQITGKGIYIKDGKKFIR